MDDMDNTSLNVDDGHSYMNNTYRVLPRTSLPLQVYACNEVCRECYFIDKILPRIARNRYFCDPMEDIDFYSFDVQHLREGIGYYRKRTLLRQQAHWLQRVKVGLKVSNVTRTIPVIVKHSKANVYLEFVSFSDTHCAFRIFHNENVFYKMTEEIYKMDIIAKCYVSSLYDYGQPIIVLEDVTAQGYRPPNARLDSKHLLLCVKALATFHAKGMKCKADYEEVFTEFRNDLFLSNFCNMREKSFQHYHGVVQLKTLLRSSLLDVDTPLYEKAMNKIVSLSSPDDMEDNQVTTFCHGCFTGDNVLFKYVSNYKTMIPVDLKIIDWESIKYFSPAIDIGVILFANLPEGDEMSKSIKFCKNVVHFYLNAVAFEYPKVPFELLKQDVINNLIFAWIILCDNIMHISNEEVRMAFKILDILGSLDNNGSLDDNRSNYTLATSISNP